MAATVEEALHLRLPVVSVPGHADAGWPAMSPQPPLVMGFAEIMERLGYRRSWTSRLVNHHWDFPAPAAHLHDGRVWMTDEVEGWISAYRPEKGRR